MTTTLVASLLCAAAVMIGNGDFWIAQDLLGIDFSTKFQQYLRGPLFVCFLLLLMTMFSFRRILQSQKINAPWWQKVALQFILIGTVYGGMAGYVGLLAKENVSGFATRRGPEVLRDDIVDTRAFAQWIRKQSINGVDFTETARAKDLKLADSEQQIFPGESHWIDWQDGVRFPIVGISSPISKQWWSNVCSAIDPFVVGFQISDDDGKIAKRYRNDYEAARQARDELATQFTKSFLGTSYCTSLLLTELAEVLPRFGSDQALEELLKKRIAFLHNKNTSKTFPSKEFLNSFHRSCSWKKEGPQSKSNSSTSKGKAAPIVFAFNGANINPLERCKFNRLLLEFVHPELIKSRAMVSTLVVVEADQRFRWLFLFWCLCAVVPLALFVDFNRFSSFANLYRRLLKQAFLEPVGGDQPLSALKPFEYGAPYPLMVGSLKIPGHLNLALRDKNRWKHVKVDGSRGDTWYSWLFSPFHVGWLPSGRGHKQATYASTGTYMDLPLRVSDAAALSGAAVTPWMAEDKKLNFLMHILNIRLDRWLPNPTKPGAKCWFPAMKLGRELARARFQPTKNVTDWKFGVIADGGFREFFGVEELLVRRCRLVIVVDAGCNNGLYEFGALADFVRQMRLDHAIDIRDLDHERPLDVRRLRRLESNGTRSPQHYILGRIRYPDKGRLQELRRDFRTDPRNTDAERYGPVDGYFVYIQMSLTGDENIDLEQFRIINPNFPDEPTTNQLYEPMRVESFRQLGEHIGDIVCGDLDVDRKDYSVEDLWDKIVGAYAMDCAREQSVYKDDVRYATIRKRLRGVPSRDTGTDELASYFDSAVVREKVREWVAHLLREPNASPPQNSFGYDVLAVECHRRNAIGQTLPDHLIFQIDGRDTLRDISKFYTRRVSEFLVSLKRPKLLIHAISLSGREMHDRVFRNAAAQTVADWLAGMCALADVFVMRHGVEAKKWSSPVRQALIASIVAEDWEKVMALLAEVDWRLSTPSRRRAIGSRRSRR